MNGGNYIVSTESRRSYQPITVLFIRLCSPGLNTIKMWLFMKYSIIIFHLPCRFIGVSRFPVLLLVFVFFFEVWPPSVLYSHVYQCQVNTRYTLFTQNQTPVSTLPKKQIRLMSSPSGPRDALARTWLVSQVYLAHSVPSKALIDGLAEIEIHLLVFQILLREAKLTWLCPYATLGLS